MSDAAEAYRSVTKLTICRPAESPEPTESVEPIFNVKNTELKMKTPKPSHCSKFRFRVLRTFR